MLPPSSSPSPSSRRNQTASSSPRRRPLHPSLLPPPPTNLANALPPALPSLPLLPDRALLPPSPSKTRQQIQPLHPLLYCDLPILQLIQYHILDLEDHVAWSRVCRRMRTFYAGEEAGVKAFWSKALLVREGWAGLPSPSPPTPTTPFLSLLRHLSHRRICSLKVLRPWKYGPLPKEERLLDPRGEWISLCASNGEEEGVWPPTTPPNSNPGHKLLRPNPFLSDLSLPLSPPPPSPSSLFEHITIITSDDSSIPLSSHAPFLNQLATWPAREVVEVEFGWDREAKETNTSATTSTNGRVGKDLSRSKEAAAAGTTPATSGGGGREKKSNEAWNGLENGRVVVVVGKKASGRLVTVQTLLEGMVDHWRAELVWEETRSLVKRFPGLDRRTVEQKFERGSWNKFLGQVRKNYGRWAWLGDQVVFVGFTPSLSHPSSRIAAHLVSMEKIESFYPPSSPPPESSRVEGRERIGGGKGEGEDVGEAGIDFEGGVEKEGEW